MNNNKLFVFGIAALMTAAIVTLAGCTADGGKNDDTNPNSQTSGTSDTNKVAAPTADPGTGAVAQGQMIALATTTEGASIRYTTDGAAPTSTTGTVYTGPFPITVNTTIKAIAYKEGMTDSAVLTSVYTIDASALPRVSMPDSSPIGGVGDHGVPRPVNAGTMITLSTYTEGASIRYTTDGTNPTSTTGTVYTGPFPITTNVEIKAIAYKEGMRDSDVMVRYYYIRLGGSISITGTPVWGNTLTVNTSNLTGIQTLTCRWSNGNRITSGPTYRVKLEDVGRTIFVVATDSDSIGSVQSANTAAATLGTNTTVPGEDSLSDIITAINAKHGTSSRPFAFTINVAGPVSNTAALPAIQSGVDLTLTGNGTITERQHIHGDSDISLFTVKSGAKLTLNGPTLHSNNTHGSVVNVASGTFTLQSGIITGAQGGGEGTSGVSVNVGKFTMNGGSISSNNGNTFGGGVAVNLGEFIMNNGTISNNVSNAGGGVYVGLGTFTYNGGIIKNNSLVQYSSFNGTQVYKSSTGTINGNGGIASSNGTTTATGTFAPNGSSILAVWWNSAIGE